MSGIIEKNNELNLTMDDEVRSLIFYKWISLYPTSSESSALKMISNILRQMNISGNVKFFNFKSPNTFTMLAAEKEYQISLFTYCYPMYITVTTPDETCYFFDFKYFKLDLTRRTIITSCTDCYFSFKYHLFKIKSSKFRIDIKIHSENENIGEDKFKEMRKQLLNCMNDIFPPDFFDIIERIKNVYGELSKYENIEIIFYNSVIEKINGIYDTFDTEVIESKEIARHYIYQKFSYEFGILKELKIYIEDIGQTFSFNRNVWEYKDEETLLEILDRPTGLSDGLIYIKPADWNGSFSRKREIIKKNILEFKKKYEKLE